MQPYDAIHHPPNSQLGGNPIAPYVITKSNRPNLTKLSHLALEYYNQEGSGSSFEFHDLVKCTFHRDVRHNAFADRPLDPTEYYI
ncbi:hypothetical protein A2U01_0052187, partial [Trifolium medium]|nr:hypothetical protein [Trifolium medium]